VITSAGRVAGQRIAEQTAVVVVANGDRQAERIESHV